MAVELAQADGGTGAGGSGDNPAAAGADGVEVPIPTDVGAQVETPIAEESLFPPFDATAFASHLFWLAIAFGLLLFLVNRLVVPRVGGILEDRRDRIASDLGEASRLSRETDEVIAAYEAELADARQKAQSIAQQRRDEIKAEIARRQAETEQSLSERVAQAEQEIAARRDEAFAEVDTIAADAAQAIVERISGVTVDAAKAADAVKKAERPHA